MVIGAELVTHWRYVVFTMAGGGCAQDGLFENPQWYRAAESALGTHGRQNSLGWVKKTAHVMKNRGSKCVERVPKWWIFGVLAYFFPLSGSSVGRICGRKQ